jgi:eukaryotic-like serine/threonine-protein kinase
MSGRALDPERWARIEELFLGALDREGAARASWLESELGDDAILRDEVDSLLAAHEGEGALPILEGLAAGEATGPDWRIGPYRLIEPIGSGGMGTVFLAEREGSDYVQRVALKLIRMGWTDPLLSERLRSERRILARLEHPNIARLIDGGVTEEGQPYYAMEYVAGTDLLTYCDRHRLTNRERVRLFLRVCEAVQHAHQQLVIHRDLKPGNILVSDEGHPKLLDFGIAKLLDGVGDEVTRSLTGAFATPAYASPEQVRGEPAGTPSDVYSLGVLLYELLAGRRPYRLENMPPAAAVRMVCEVEPPRPSEVVARDPASLDRAPLRSSGVERWRRDLDGDLDVVVMKALAKETARRYGTAEQLAEDLRAWLDGRPVGAQPDRLFYRATRFARRHRTAVALAAAAVLSLAGGTLVSLSQANRATQQAALASAERDRARDEAEKARLVTAMMGDLFRLGDPTVMQGDTVTVLQLLNEGSARVERELSDQPDVQATLLGEVARVYGNLGLLDRAETLSRRVVEIRTALLGETDPTTAAALGQLGDVLAARGRRAEAIATLGRAVEIREGAGVVDTLTARLRTDLAWQLRATGEYGEAETLFTRSLQDFRRTHGDAAIETAPALLGLAATLHDSGRFDDAEALFRDALARTDTTDRPHPLAAAALLNVGMLQRLRERYANAEPLLRSAYRMRLSLYQEDHPDVLDAAKELGRVLNDLGRHGEAERLLGPALARSAGTLGTSHPTTGSLREALAWSRLSEGRWHEAAALYDTVVAKQKERHAGDHPEIVFALVRSGHAVLATGRVADAEARYREALRMSERVSGTTSVYRLLALHGLGNVARAHGRQEEAAGNFAEAEALAAQLLRPDHRYVRALTLDRGLLALERGDARAAVVILAELAETEARVLPLPHPDHGRTLIALARARLESGDGPGARRAADAARVQLATQQAAHPQVRALGRFLEDPRLGGGPGSAVRDTVPDRATATTGSVQ